MVDIYKLFQVPRERMVIIDVCPNFLSDRKYTEQEIEDAMIAMFRPQQEGDIVGFPQKEKGALK